MPNTCIHCGGPVEDGHTTAESFEREGRVVLFTSLPCSKCRQCGAVFFSGDVLARIEQQTEPVLGDEALDAPWVAVMDWESGAAVGMHPPGPHPNVPPMEPSSSTYPPEKKRSS